MSSPDGFSNTSLLLRLSPSRLNGSLHLAVLLLSLSALWINDLFDLPLKITLSMCVIISVGSSLYCLVLLRHPRSVLELIFDGRDWQLRRRDGSLTRVSLMKPLYAGTLFIVIELRVDKESLPVVIARDSICEDTYRRSLVFFRWATLS